MLSKRRPFHGMQIPLAASTPIKRRYSVTADIVSMRRCPKQYAAFGVYRFAPAYQTQIWYGMVIHQVLDYCHAHFRGQLDPATEDQVPDDGKVLARAEVEAWFRQLRQARHESLPEPPPPSDVLRYFMAVDDSLRGRGVRAIAPALRTNAVMVLQHFNALEGPSLYPRVIDTEHRLQADRGKHILHGVIDLLAESLDADADECEIWDYKGIDPLHGDDPQLETLRFQMRVYAHLYRIKHGALPRRARLYFVGSLPKDDTPPEKRPVDAVEDVDLDPELVDQAMAEFDQTVAEIERCRENDTWPPAAPGTIDDQCKICDLRWNCPTGNAPMRYP